MPSPLRAKHQRGSQRVLRLETPIYLTAEEAGRRLAAAFPDQPVIQSESQIKAAMQQAGKLASIDLRGVDESLAAAYAERMRRLPARMYKYDEGGQRVGAGHPDATVMRFDMHTYWTASEAATALARQFGEDVSAKLGWTQAWRLLHRAARAEIEKDATVWAVSEPFASVQEQCRQLLVQFGVFDEGD